MKSSVGEEKQLQPFELLLDQQKLARRITELGEQITTDYARQMPVLLGVLKGCVVFLADLMRNISLPVEVEFVSAASYRNGRDQDDDVLFGGAVPISLKARHVLIIEGVVDTGRTVSMILKQLAAQEPASVEIVTLLDKPASHRVGLEIKYKGFTVGNEFVIGYGLDNTQLYRNLPFIGKMIDR